MYAHRRESRFHADAAALIRQLAEGTETWAIPWPCLYEFFSVVTNPKIWKDMATPPEAAARQIESWVRSPSATLLGEPIDFLENLLPMMQQPRVRGPVIHDARIAALCLAHGVERLLTKDRDFQLFPELRTSDPLA